MRRTKNVQQCAVQIQQRIQTNLPFGIYHQRIIEKVRDKHKRKSGGSELNDN